MRRCHAGQEWGLRGGGGNFGIITGFEFQLHPVGPDVLSGLIVFPFEQAKSVITQFARFTETMPDDLNPTMISAWKRHLLDSAAEFFDV